MRRVFARKPCPSGQDSRKKEPERDTDRCPRHRKQHSPGRQADARKTRGIRFSDSEREEVKTAAERHAVPAAEFVREKIFDFARNPDGANFTAVPPSLAPLIERMFRYTWMLATLRRDELIREGRGEEIEKLVQEARVLQESLLRSPSE